MKQYRIELESDQNVKVIKSIQYYTISQILEKYDFRVLLDENKNIICEGTDEMYYDFLLTYENKSDLFRFKLSEIV